MTASARVLAALALAGAALSCSPTGDYAHLYRVSDHAPGYAPADIQALKHLGPTFADHDRGVNFGVYSQRATRIDLLLFDDPATTKPARTVSMTRFGDVWNAYVEGVGVGQLYGYRAWGPNWLEDPKWYPGSIDGFQADVDAQGNRFNPNKLLLDPYALAVTGDHNWSVASVASGPARTQTTYAASAKCIVVKSKYAWSAGETDYRNQRQDPTWVGHRWQDAILYETHPKGFTMSPASGVLHPGTFRGVGEKADYLADLGITAVELMPVMLKPLDGGYWGYDTLLFFVPQFDFTVADPDPAAHLDEFKWMVDQLHQRNIEVVLDVVYNHTGEGGLWRDKLQLNGPSLAGPLFDQLSNYDAKEVSSVYSYRGLDNWSYYALGPDGTGRVNQTFCSQSNCNSSGCDCNDGTHGCGGSCNTGVGQETRANNLPMRTLILDSLHYWVEQMHVDGFRFDLAPVLAEEDLQPLNNSLQNGQKNTVIQDVIDDPILQQYNVRVIAEPWSLASYSLGAFPAATTNPGDAWYEWNGNFRDWWREFVNYDTWALNQPEGADDGGGTLTGSKNLFGWNGRKPYHSVNFVTVHDGFTMFDLLSYAQKQNLCGPLDLVCCNTPTSPFCDPNSGNDNERQRDWGGQNDVFKRQLMRNLFTAMMISEGTPMLLGGDEWMRTQLGNNNAYSDSADNEYNWYDWGTWQASDFRNRMHDFVRKLIKLRKDHAYAFVATDYGAPFAWLDENAQPMAGAKWSGRHVMMSWPASAAGPALAVLINMELAAVDFHLPPGNWSRLMDTQQYYDTDAYFLNAPSLDPLSSQNVSTDAPVPVPGSDYNAQTRSIVILQAQ